MLDWHHLRDNKTTYLEHLCFAVGVAGRLIPTILLLLLHAVIPVLKIPKKLSISGTSDYLFDKDYEIRSRILELETPEKK